MIRVGITRAGAELGLVHIRTKHGEEYTFPAMDKNELERVVAKGDSRVPSGTPTLALVNASFAVLSVPFHIIAEINVDGESWWTCPLLR